MTSAVPVATVAMVTYNSRPYVRDAIESVLSQDLRDLELVICDDASTDGTWDLIGQSSDPRIRAVRNLANIGEYANRNQALSLARGKYVIFIDGDDYLYPHGLAYMVRMLEQFPNAGFAGALGWSERFVYPVELTPEQYFRCQFLGPSVTARDFTQLLFRTEALRNAGGFDPRYRTGDTYIQFLIGMSRNTLLISDGLAWWRRTPGQASESLVGTHRGLAEATRYGLELLAHPQCPLSAPEARLARSVLCGRMIRVAFRYALRGRIIHAWELLRASGISAPDLRHFLTRGKRPFLGERNGRNPVKVGIPPSG